MSSARGTKGFKGNKAGLPSKPCTVCGRDMSWRKAWARNWDEVLYCSEACRKNKAMHARAS
jgi:hypothetical protein